MPIGIIKGRNNIRKTNNKFVSSWLRRARNNFLGYDYEQYWIKRGVKMKEIWEDTPIYKSQEEAILRTLESLEFKSVLELGCGFGRITGLILQKRNYIERYLAIDISKQQIEHVKNNFPTVETICAPIHELKKLGKFDLVIAVDFLMHIKPKDIENVMRLMYESHTNHILNNDYYPKTNFALPKLAQHNFLHNYPNLYRKLGLTPLKKQHSNLQAIFYTKKTTSET